jgi:hypothetical protein
VTLVRSVNGPRELFKSPTIVKQRASAITRKGQLVAMAGKIVVPDAFAMERRAHRLLG